ncbi:MAG TPA: HlyD family secretion protein [Planctomycetota bacterium]|nr:HlyD family secretion protein [Planctomycetota bacterium]
MTTTDPPIAAAMPAAPPPPPSRPRTLRRAAFALLLLAGVAAGTWWFIAGLGSESTDDAFLAADVYQVNASVAGRVLRVLVADNETVPAGQLLAEIDPADYQAKVSKARAALALAQAQQQEAVVEVEWTAATTDSAVTQLQAELTAVKARLQQELAERDAAQSEAERSSADQRRYEQLSERAVTRQRLEVVQSSAVAAESALRASHKRVAAATAEIAAAEARLATATANRMRVQTAKATAERRAAEVRQAEAELQTAELALSYTRILAPAAGRVAHKAVLPGTWLQAGQSLMAVVGAEVWVVANFKETQLRSMRPGQHATVYIDAAGVDLPAHLDSLQAGSGAFFSLLPPENASGNFVKVVQRVPVKLRFDQQPDPRLQLGPGMSVVPSVAVR